MFPLATVENQIQYFFSRDAKIFYFVEKQNNDDDNDRKLPHERNKHLSSPILIETINSDYMKLYEAFRAGKVS
jgi:hypothetical protein